jgi:UDP-glucose 4-epimerase
VLEYYFIQKITKVGLTGGTGMVGQHVKALLDYEGIQYVDVSRSQWDLVDWKSRGVIDSLLGDVDALLHIGAAVPSPLDPLETQVLFDANVRACVAIAEWATNKHVPVVYLSGAPVYKDPHGSNICEDDEKTTNNFGGFYGFTKYLAEQVFSHYVYAGLQLIVLRPTSIYGAGLGGDKLVGNFFHRAKKNEAIEIQAPHDNTVNFIHAADVARAILLSLQHNAWGIYNISAAENNTIEQLAHVCVDQAGSGKVTLIDGDTDSPKPFLRFDLNHEKAFKAFGYAAQIPLNTGVKMFAANCYLYTG